MRVPEYFGMPSDVKQKTVANFPSRFYKQERDWTCAIACLRTMLSGFLENIPSENYYLDKYNMLPGPYYSKDIKELGLLSDYNAIFSCDMKTDDIDIGIIGKLLGYGYFVMVESLYNYAHWYVVIGYCAVKDEADLEKHRMLIYDPFYDEVKLLNVHEFTTMWCDSDGHEKEFIAVKE